MNTAVEDSVYRSFELAAERVGDLVGPVYARYFERDPDAASLMSHMDPLTRGRMLEEVLRLLMTGDYTGERAYLDFEVKNHAGAYHVHGHMYGELLEAVRDTVRAGIGGDWDAECAAAWETRMASLVDEIGRRLAG